MSAPKKLASRFTRYCIASPAMRRDGAPWMTAEWLMRLGDNYDRRRKNCFMPTITAAPRSVHDKLIGYIAGIEINFVERSIYADCVFAESVEPPNDLRAEVSIDDAILLGAFPPEYRIEAREGWKV